MIILIFLMSFFLALPLSSAEKTTQNSISIPGAEVGTGFDDMLFSPAINKLLVPGGGTGQVLLIDPKSGELMPIGSLSPVKSYHGGHGEGVTSADQGQGYIFTIDRTAKTVNAWDIAKNQLIASSPVSSDPDYVRYVSLTNEVWVTEPTKQRIEIFDFSDASLEQAGFIEIIGGPESLVIDQAGEKAYAHLWKGITVVMDVKTRQIIEKWPNSCASSHGIALDEANGWLFVGCSEGKIVVLNLKEHGKIRGALATAGAGVDVIGYSPSLSHIYLAAAQSAKLSIVEVSKDGAVDLVGIKNIATGSHCVSADNAGGIWVCDPQRGRLLFFKDDY